MSTRPTLLMLVPASWAGLWLQHFEKANLNVLVNERDKYSPADVDYVFQGWSGAWLDPHFTLWNIEDCIAYIRVPVLAIQGLDDQYGTLAQIEALVEGSYAPVETVLFEDCKHSPHLEQPARTVAAIVDFHARLERIEAAPLEVR